MSPRSVTRVPLGNSAWQVGGQSMPGGSLVTFDALGDHGQLRLVGIGIRVPKRGQDLDVSVEDQRARP